MIALIAHDRQKPQIVEFARRNQDFFRTQRLVATASTGTLLREQVGLDVECVAHGPEGGDLMIGGRVAAGQIEAVLFLRDPLTAQPHEPDVSALMRVCDVHAVPLATNLATAEAVVMWLRDRAVVGATAAAGRQNDSSADHRSDAAQERAESTWAVHRQDDNGQRFVVQTGLSRDDAKQLAAVLEARGHKQLYWAEQ